VAVFRYKAHNYGTVFKTGEKDKEMTPIEIYVLKTRPP
jgi:hypothetical protein